MNISFFGNDRQFENIKEQWMERASSVWSSGQFLFGPSVEKLEQELARKCQRKYCVALASCTEALTIALRYLNLPKESKVMVTNYSFLASATPILKNKLTPHFVDVDPSFFHPLKSNYEKVISPKDKAMIAVSLFGTSSEMDEIEIFCNEKRIPLIEDAAQSFGSMYKTRAAGSFGLASCLSFDPTKFIAASSSAGALVTNDRSLYTFAKQVRLHGKNEDGDFTIIGGKSLISSVEAELLSLKLEYLDKWLDKRNQIASHYQSELCDIEQLQFPKSLPKSTHTFHKYVIQTSVRDNLLDFLLKQGISCRKHYAKTISEETIFKDIPADTPNAKMISERVISLPLYQELKDHEIDYVITSIKQFFQR